MTFPTLGTMSHPFIHLHVHSAYSLGEGAIPIKKLAQQVHAMGMPAVGLADRDNLFGALEFSMACAEKGIQPLVGVDLHVHYPQPPRPYAKHDLGRTPLVFMAQNEVGYRHLMALASYPYFDPHDQKRVGLSLQRLQGHTEGLIVLTGGQESYLNRLIAQDEMKQAQEHLEFLSTCFPGRLYVELMRYGLPQERAVEDGVLDLAYRLRLPIVATHEVFFDVPERYQAHDAFLCVSQGTYVTEIDRYRVTPEHYLKSPAEMAVLFADLPEALENTSVIAQRCSIMPKPRAPILPPFLCEGTHTETEELETQAFQGLDKRLTTISAEQHESYRKRLRYELDVIQKMGFSGYFLIVSDFIKWSKAQKIPVGPGRGSGAGSLVAWALTVTDIDPIRFQLLFERFLNPERVSMPDFDIDFCQEKRDRVIEYVCQKYGADRVAHIITFGKLQARAVLRDVGRVLQMPYTLVDKICKLVPHNPAQPVDLQEAIKIEPQLQQMIQQEESIQHLVDIALQLEGLYRHASTHAAGVVIGDRPLLELVPLYQDPRSSLPATQFSMKYVELAGLLKFDFLGLKTLTVLAYTVDLIKKYRGIEVDLSHIPLDDPAPFALLHKVDTTGIFQLESKGMRDVVRRLKPDRFEEIIALVALYRPGPMDDIPRYLGCKQGTENVQYLHPKLEPILSETFGVMVYQEQVMQIAQVLAGYTLGQADLLRRAMGKKIRSEMEAQEKQFVEGAIARGVDPDVAAQIFHQMSKFAGYGFNKSHSAPYALLAYQTAYLKAHFLPEFMCALMTLDMHNTDKLGIYAQELHHGGLCLLPPDINQSWADFSVERDEAGKFALRYGLAAIKNVGRPFVEALVKERQDHGPYASPDDLFRRLEPSLLNKRQVEHLIFAGAFDGIGSSRLALHRAIEMSLKDAQRAQHQAGLFEHSVSPSLVKGTPSLEEWPTLEKLDYERQAIGFYLSSHPLKNYESLLKAQGYQTLLTLERGGATEWSFRLAGIITQIQKRRTKAGQVFAFIQLSDPTGMTDVAVFPELYQKIGVGLAVGQQVTVTGQGRDEGDSFRLVAESVEPFDTFLQNHLRIVRFHVHDASAVHPLNELLAQASAGPSRVELLVMPEEAPKMLIFRLPHRIALSLSLLGMLEKIPGLGLKI